MQTRILSTSTTRGGLEYVVLGIDGGCLCKCLALKALMVSPLGGATPGEHNLHRCYIVAICSFPKALSNVGVVNMSVIMIIHAS